MINGNFRCVCVRVCVFSWKALAYLQLMKKVVPHSRLEIYLEPQTIEAMNNLDSEMDLHTQNSSEEYDMDAEEIPEENCALSDDFRNNI